MDSDTFVNYDTLGEIVASQHPGCPTDAESRAGKWLETMSNPEKCAEFLDTIPKPLAETSLLYMEWYNILAHFGGRKVALQAFNSARQPLELPNTYPELLHHLYQCEFSLPGASFPRSFWDYLRNRAIASGAAFRIAMEWYASKHYSGRDAVLNVTQEHGQWLLHQDIAPKANITPWLNDMTYPYLPYYLWDLQQRKTVIVHELSNVPTYITISHTWGRFRKMNGKQACFKDLSGVPWRVPEVDSIKFDVSELPQKLFQGLHHLTDYVWLDLFCIPQDRSPLSEQEIARQGSIFRNSIMSLAWLNENDGWSDTQEVLRYLCSCVIDDAAKIGLVPTMEAVQPQLPSSYPNELIDVNVLNPWFTSLWTLQEICLCPGMIPCDKNFKVLQIAEGLRPLTFPDIQALIDETSHRANLSNKLKSIKSVLWNVSLSRKEQWSPMSILHLGNTRHCEGRRAEAIMSAVGAIEWFQPTTSTILQQEDRLILKTYPPEFIRELREKYGSGTFFHAAQPKYEVISQIFYDGKSPEGLSDIGSMLPFGPHAYSAGVPSISGQFSEATTETWSIDKTGKVHVTEAFIQLSRRNADVELELQCHWKAPMMTKSTAREHHWQGFGEDFASLCKWLEEFHPETETYAVRLTDGDHWCQGMLLKELVSGDLLKVGVYTLGRTRLDISWPGQRCATNWIVL